MVDKRTPRHVGTRCGRSCGATSSATEEDRAPSCFRRGTCSPCRCELTPPERRFYDAVTEFVREGFRRAGSRASGALPLVTLQRELCSSAPAAMSTLQRMYERTDGPERAARMRNCCTLGNQVLDTSSKCDALLRTYRDSRSDEQFIVFTEYRMTQRYIRWRLEQAGIASLAFRRLHVAIAQGVDAAPVSARASKCWSAPNRAAKG